MLLSPRSVPRCSPDFRATDRPDARLAGAANVHAARAVASRLLKHAPMLQGRRIEIEGIVQGVGFRPWVYRLAHELQLGGHVCNGPAGVTIEAFGAPSALERFVERLGREAPPAAAIRRLDWQPIPAQEERAFRISASETGGAVHVSIPADLATCEACLAEIFDRSNRRHRYPFTNCTDCGPRFTIAREAPYDRPSTTMARFKLCAACQREYDDPLDRRFHAQPNACPDCGPSLRLVGGEGDPLTSAGAALRAGQIVALKGIGGYHLAVSARDQSAVERLRERKHREEKPFAVMVRDLDEARQLAILSREECALLTSIERPIVLVSRRPEAQLAVAVAPRLAQLGLMLAYSPLHHLLLAEVGGPLVMTSGNLSDEPIAFRDDDALSRLRGIADLFLVHDREIDARCEDSIARVIAKRPVLLRRSRGYVPRVIPLSRPVSPPILAVGAQLKNTFCIAAGDAAVLGPHIGDLDSTSTYESLIEGVERMQRFLGVHVEAVAHDLHPQYLSTGFARSLGLPLIGVQHHHAHIASAMAEHGIESRVLGLAFDGTGLGSDGALWGGEFLLGDLSGFQRIATLRPLPLAGGERAIHEVWRLALALLDDAYDGRAPLEKFPLFASIPESRIALVRQMIARDINTPMSHGVGRLFDAVGALVLARPDSHYEGQIALEWNLAAANETLTPAPFLLDKTCTPWQLDLRPLVRALADGVTRNAAPSALSALFHDTLACASAHVVREIAAQFGALPVVLTGGCFQNARLTEAVVRELSPSFDLHLHQSVPPGDGGLALGQALIADAQLRR